MMNSFGALHKYDLEIQFNRRDLYQTSAFCGHVFTMKLLLKKITLGHMTKNKCGYQMHIFVTSFSKQHAPVWRCFCMVQPLRQPFRPKCTNRILQMHQQNPVVPSESGVHPQNPVCTYSVRLGDRPIFCDLYTVKMDILKKIGKQLTISQLDRVECFCFDKLFIWTPEYFGKNVMIYQIFQFRAKWTPYCKWHFQIHFVERKQ